MDFDNRKVYGDTSITDGLVSSIKSFEVYYCTTKFPDWHYFSVRDIEARIYAFILYKESSAIQVCLVLHAYLSPVIEISLTFQYFLGYFQKYANIVIELERLKRNPML